MTKKRSRSPSDDSYRQRKMHVGEKELNDTKDEYMKEIYAKTLDKLFEGGKKNLDASDNCNQGQYMETKALHQLKQTFLDNKCQLHTNGKEIKDGLCSSCNSSNCSNLKCFFCEINFSECKIFACNKCTQQYCSSCIFSVFEEEEVCICRSCY